MPDDLDLTAIRARAEAATPGPWIGVGDRRSKSAYGLVGRLSDRGTGNAIAVLAGVGMDRVADAEFIGHARTDIPDLLARLTELEAENSRFREVVRRVLDRHDTIQTLCEADEFDLRNALGQPTMETADHA